MPPASNAGRSHGLRVYHTVQGWIGNELPPTKYRYYKQTMSIGQIMFNPGKMTIPPAPEKLLKMVRCNCQVGGCSSRRCSCLKYGQLCTPVFGGWEGLNCRNASDNEDIDTWPAHICTGSVVLFTRGMNNIKTIKIIKTYLVYTNNHGRNMRAGRLLVCPLNLSTL